MLFTRGLRVLQIPIDFGLPDQLENTSYHDRPLFRVQCTHLIVLIHKLFEFEQVAIRFGSRHGWNEVIHNHGMSPAFGLCSLAGIVDDIGIEIGQRPERELGVTFGAQRDTFPRQPLQVAMFPDMHDRVGTKDITDPLVIAEIEMGRWQVWAVIDRGRILAVAPRRLDADVDVAEEQAWYGKPLTVLHVSAGRLAPP